MKEVPLMGRIGNDGRRHLNKKQVSKLYEECFELIESITATLPGAIYNLCFAKQKKERILFREFDITETIKMTAPLLAIKSERILMISQRNILDGVGTWDQDLIMFGSLTGDKLTLIAKPYADPNYKIPNKGFGPLREDLYEKCFDILMDMGLELVEADNGEGQAVFKIAVEASCVKCPNFLECKGL